MSALDLAEALRPPTEAEVEEALRRFRIDLTAHYGTRIAALYLFGSRARGNHRPDSDADVVVVLTDGDWRLFREKMKLAEIATETIVDTGVHVQGWPVSLRVWECPNLHSNPALIENMRRDAKVLP